MLISQNRIFLLTTTDNGQLAVNLVAVRKSVVQILHTFTVDIDGTICYIFTSLAFYKVFEFIFQSIYTTIFM